MKWTSSDRINEDPRVGRIPFNSLAEHYLKADFDADAVRPKSVNTIPIVEHYVRDYLIKKFNVPPVTSNSWQ